MKGRIHSFESFGTVDGPGIRFIVFMQGCPLKCKYCQNRDTWAFDKGTEYTPEEVVSKVLRYKPYFNTSGGGVTVSGGEPLAQAKFLTELFKLLKEEKISTCIDTAGSYKITPEIEELLEVTDLVLLDIKHIDSKKAIELTGMDNTNNLAFAKYLNEKGIPMWIRQVLVPGYTDDEEDLIKEREFIDTLSNVQKIEVLPYHNLGKFKWTDLGLKYYLEDVTPPTPESIEKAKKILIK